MIWLCLNIFQSTWCKGIEEAIMGLDENLYFPLPEMYIEYSSWRLSIAFIPRCLALVIRDRFSFNMAWPKMEPCFHFLMGWRKIAPMTGQGWLTNYLKLHKAYVHPGVTFEDIDKVNFCTSNIEKTSKEKSSFEFPYSLRKKILVILLK